MLSILGACARPVLSLVVAATITLPHLGCRTCCPCPPLPPGEPLIQGTMRIDPAAKQAVLNLQIGGAPGLSADSRGRIDLWVGPDPVADQGVVLIQQDGTAVFKPTGVLNPGAMFPIGSPDAHEFECLPWRNPLHTRVWSWEEDEVDDLVVIARVTAKVGPMKEWVVGSFVKYFEMPEQDYSWSFTGTIWPTYAQAVIGGKPGSDNAPMVGVVYDVLLGQPRFTFGGGELQAPTHGWRPKRAWFWRIASETPPAWDDRSMHVDDAFWSTDDVPPLPTPVPTASNPVVPENMTCQAGVRYWFYAIVEESDGTTTRYHAHRSIYSRSGAVADAQPLGMIISPDEDTTSVGPVGS